MYQEEMKSLKGLKVNSLSMNVEKTLLVLHTDQGDKKLYAVGDCCSNSWFENITGVDNLVGHTIEKVANNSFPELTKKLKDARYSYCEEVIKFYSFSMKTEKGTFEIEYRNSSNGYYSGDIEIDNEPYDFELSSLKELKKDF